MRRSCRRCGPVGCFADSFMPISSRRFVVTSMKASAVPEHVDFPTLYSATVCRAIDISLAVLPQPGEFADLDLLMWLQLVMVEQPVLCTSPDVIARDELHRGLTYRAKPLVILCHQLL